jgi:(p)ppGpp synthase/HD superfamily hydrolase
MSSAPGVETLARRSPLVGRAMEAAAGAHAGQTRNASGGLPYIEHPIAVAEALIERDCGDEVVAAALLHDVVEDSDLEVSDVRELAGDRVAELVDALTDDSSIEPYAERKREHRARVEDAGRDALAIYAADKLTNARMLRTAYEEEGEDVAEELKVPLDVKVGVWESDLEMVRGRAAGDPLIGGLAEELAGELSRLADDRSARRDRPPSG